MPIRRNVPALLSDLEGGESMDPARFKSQSMLTRSRRLSRKKGIQAVEQLGYPRMLGEFKSSIARIAVYTFVPSALVFAQ